MSITVVDARWVKPLDEELLAEHARSMKYIVTLEDHQRAGGFGSAVLEGCNRMRPARDGLPPLHIKVLGIPDCYVEHRTTREEQLAVLGLDAEGVCRSVRGLFSAQAVK